MTTLNEYIITIDVDWASDPIINKVANYLIENQVKATWFITHDSLEIKRLSRYPDRFELGIHPNFSEGSTQGETPKEIMSHLLSIVPQAKSVRTHKLIQSSELLLMMREFNILYDSSVPLPDTPNIIPYELFLSKNKWLLRFPCFWWDDHEMNKPSPCFSLTDSRYHVNGLKNFAFHPIHIALNSSDTKNYYACKSKLDITKCSLSEIQNYSNTSGEGTGTFFKELVQFIKTNLKSSSLTLSELALKWASVKGLHL